MDNAPKNFINKRNFSRLQVRLLVKYAPVADYNNDPYNEHQFRADARVGMLLDIGGGGLRFISEEEIFRRTILRFKLQLPTMPDGHCDLFGMVVAATPYAQQSGRWMNRIAFIDIPEHLQDKIISYICTCKYNQDPKKEQF